MKGEIRLEDKIYILIVDDDMIVRESMSNWLKEEGYAVDTSEDGLSGLEKIKTNNYDLAVVDIKMPGMDGIELLKLSKEIYPDLPILVMTAYASVDTAVQAMKDGAFDYIVKPFDPENVSHIIRRSVKFKRLEKENILLRKELEKKYGFDEIIGKSKEMEEVFELIRTIADSEAVVMIRGESGTGKELIARAIHANSKRKYGPLVALSCGALPDSLLESELFGYEKGAFTGANYSRKGRIEMANGGSLFLDEIGDISPKTQVDLLRVLQDRIIYRLGSTKPVNVDIRVISATHRNLEEAIREGAFREDLYYRLNVVTINVPPLRDKKEDIPLLANHFLHKFVLANSKKVEGISGEAMEILIRYNWPGNIRELENVIERAVVICKNNEIVPDDLSEVIKKSSNDTIPRTLDESEKQHVTRILNENNWNIKKSAEELGIDRATLYNKIKKYEIEKQK
ncbi:MAG: sigma-54-dependent Fis family transcriptional regulator [Candidatus Aminicenantes bacterium]|nr:sigma-54-dependent Fis family transcriptional regulator [Candidatus Aminicenantes bacterium]